MKMADCFYFLRKDEKRKHRWFSGKRVIIVITAAATLLGGVSVLSKNFRYAPKKNVSDSAPYQTGAVYCELRRVVLMYMDKKERKKLTEILTPELFDLMGVNRVRDAAIVDEEDGTYVYALLSKIPTNLRANTLYKVKLNSNKLEDIVAIKDIDTLKPVIRDNAIPRSLSLTSDGKPIIEWWGTTEKIWDIFYEIDGKLLNNLGKEYRNPAIINEVVHTGGPYMQIYSYLEGKPKQITSGKFNYKGIEPIYYNGRWYIVSLISYKNGPYNVGIAPIGKNGEIIEKEIRYVTRNRRPKRNLEVILFNGSPYATYNQTRFFSGIDKICTIIPERILRIIKDYNKKEDIEGLTWYNGHRNGSKMRHNIYAITSKDQKIKQKRVPNIK